jgi:hypothetical protein
MKKLKFLDIDATEFARQLTIIESKLYGKIKSTECLDKTWQRKTKGEAPDPAPNVKSVILHSNQLTNWVAEMILQQAEVKKRVIVIKHFVTIADVRTWITSRPIRHANSFPEMPPSKQLLNTYFHRVSSGDRTNPQTQPHLGPDEPKDCWSSGINATINGKHEEFCRLSRKASPSQPTMYSVSRYMRTLD